MVNVFSLFAIAQAQGGNGGCSEHTFFGLVPWYHYLKVVFDPVTNGCKIEDFTLLGKHSDVLLVLLAIVDDLLRLAGLVAIGFIIYAGIKYITSQGSPDETAKAQSTIVNALVGLVIAMIAVAAVSFIGNQLGSSGGGATGTDKGTVDASSLPDTTGVADGSVLKTILTLVFGAVGALSLLFIVIGGVRYVMSQGDSQALTKAKNTILYALVGLIVAMFAGAIVTFVIGKV